MTLSVTLNQLNHPSICPLAQNKNSFYESNSEPLEAHFNLCIAQKNHKADPNISAAWLTYLNRSSKLIQIR